MPDDVIRRIEQMARKEDSDFVFQDRHGNLLFEEQDDPQPIAQPTDDEEEYDIDSYLHPEEDLHDEATGVEDDKDDNTDNEDDQTNTTNNDVLDTHDNTDSEAHHIYEEDAQLSSHPKVTGVSDTAINDDIDDDIPDLKPHDAYDSDSDDEDENDSEDQPYKTRSGRISRKPPTFEPSMSGKKYIEINNMTYEVKKLDDEELQIISLLFNQMSLGQGLKKFGEQGENAAFKEMDQLHKRTTLNPLDRKGMISE
jgi:hypothetical protein